jgi:hypothetical protein
MVRLKGVTEMEIALVLIGLLLFLFVPSFNAIGRRHNAKAAITMTLIVGIIALLFGGWWITGILWIVCLIWSCSSNTIDRDARQAWMMAMALKRTT